MARLSCSLVDAVRGAPKVFSNDNSEEISSGQWFNSFDSDGFTVGKQVIHINKWKWSYYCIMELESKWCRFS